jgi:cytochrome c553
MAITWATLLAIAFLGASPVVAFGESAKDDSSQLEFFEKHVRPLLAKNCHTCHSADTNSKGGLRVDDRNGLIAGGGRGPAIVPGQPDESLLIKAIRRDDKLKMPPEKPLSDDEVATLTKWVADGAAWTKVRVPASIGKSPAKYEKLRKEHWAWQPFVASVVPQIKDAAWPRDDIDQYILAKLEDDRLPPVGDADQLSLIRRVTYDLTGLPPTLDETDDFVADSSADAFAKVVDRLLASSAFGERWGRHWLDVARYGESTGSARNLPYPHAWRYRDYVIDAFNCDKPYDRFLREQLAGDLLAANSPEERAEQLVATGFLALGVKDVNQRFKVRYIMDNVDEQIDTVSRAVLALTVSCARCHDHKFDPIPTTDYYALAGIFRSSDLCAGLRNKMGGGGLDYYDTQMLLHIGLDNQPAVASDEKIVEAKKAVEQARADFQTLRDSPDGDVKAADGRPQRAVARQKLTRLEAELAALADPAANGPMAVGVRDSKAVGDTEVRIRGEAEKLGPVVPRGFLGILQFRGQPTVNPEQSGRLELATWLTSEKNPLTSRVIVNRIWQHLFGAGLVKTVDNFGVTGDVPSHPELLDHLANRFVRDGWSIKKLVRTIVLTRAYQLSSDATAAHVAIDPANRLVWRHSPRRLDAEELRDATLAAAGKLNLTRPDASPAKDFKVTELRNNGPEAGRLAQYAAASPYRSVYLPLLRGLTPISLGVFDFAEQGMVTGSRDTTTVAPQALYLLNDPFVRRQSLTLAERLLQKSGLDDDARIHLAYRLTVSRPATSQEVERALSYLSDYEAAVRDVITVADAVRPNPAGKKSPAGNAPPNQSQNAKPPKKLEVIEPVNPDEPVRTDEQAEEQPIRPANPKAAAWASFCQALLGASEFRYLK